MVTFSVHDPASLLVHGDIFLHELNEPSRFVAAGMSGSQGPDIHVTDSLRLFYFAEYIGIPITRHWNN